MITSLTLVLLLIACVLGVVEYRRTKQMVTPWSLFLALSIYDVFAPAAVMLTLGTGSVPAYVSNGLEEAIPKAVVLFTISAMLFGISYSLIDHLWIADEEACGRNNRYQLTIREPAALGLYTVALILQLATFREALIEAGSFVDWGRVALTTRFRSDEIADTSFLARLSAKIGMPLLLAMTGVLFQLRGRRMITYGALLPGLTFMAALLSLLRGNVLNLMIGLSIIATTRLQPQAKKNDNNATSHGNKLLMAGALIFITISIVRNRLTEWAWGVEPESSSLTSELTKLFRGDTLVGIASIIEHYSSHPLLAGKTIVDMLLMPIPRFIYTSKPAWYGIDDITRAMGWPSSTQSAVGMPGELFANFSYFGAAGMVVYGVSFALFRRLSRSGPGQVMYGFVLLPAMFATFWMGFTGFISQVSTVPTIIACLWVVYRQQPKCLPSSSPQLQ